MKKDRIRIAFIGSGGDGVMSVASIVMQSAANLGINGLMAQSYGPQIRGGESAAYVHLSREKVYAEHFKKDVILCFNTKRVDRFKNEFDVADNSLLICEKDANNPFPDWVAAKVSNVIHVPFKELLEEVDLPKVSKNMFAFGMLVKMFKWDFKKSTLIVEKTFSSKGPVIANNNIMAFKRGYIYAENIDIPLEFDLSVDGGVPLRSASGNRICAEAAVKAGCRFFAGYPITPSTEILNNILKLLPLKGGKVVQGEDEIASLGMVIGASYGGVPAMTATSGPGLSLMTEMLGLASMTAIPVVVINVQRGGPSTGIPSKTEQSDLYHSIYGGHGDFPRIVLAVTDVEDSWYMVYKAFYLAEKYRVPVIVHSDGYIGQRTENIPVKLSVDGLSKPRRIKAIEMPCESSSFRDLYPDLPEGVNPIFEPGLDENSRYLHVAGIEQDDKGKATATKTDHDRNSLRRLTKMKSIKKETSDWYKIVGQEKSKLGFVAWGSTCGAVSDMIESKKSGKLFIPKIVHPFPKDAFVDFVNSVDKLIFVELNYQGQLYHYVKSFVNIPDDTISLKIGGGAPLSPFELEKRVEELGINEVQL